MDFSCPDCQTSLATQLPQALPDTTQRRFLPFKRTLSCPVCHTPLRFNWHPIEKLSQRALLIVLLTAVIVDYLTSDVRWLLLIGGLALLGEFALQAWLGRRLPHWLRYQKHHVD